MDKKRKQSKIFKGVVDKTLMYRKSSCYIKRKNRRFLFANLESKDGTKGCSLIRYKILSDGNIIEKEMVLSDETLLILDNVIQNVKEMYPERFAEATLKLAQWAKEKEGK